jgi:hypothetical protein
MMDDYMEKGPTDCWPWNGTPEDAPFTNNKMACRNPVCCNPRHIVSALVEEQKEPEKNLEIEVKDVVTIPEPEPVKRGRGRPRKVE